MTKVFLKYFLSIFAIACIVAMFLFGVLVLQYGSSQNSWKTQVYNDFVDSVMDAIENPGLGDFGMNSIFRAVSEINDSRVSGFVIRDVEGSRMFSFGKNPDGRQLSFSGQYSTSAGEKRTAKVKNSARVNIATPFGGSSKVTVESVSRGSADVDLPSSLQDEDIIGSIIINVDGSDSFIIDLLTYSPRTYEYSKDIINSCFKAILIALPVCLAFALVAAWVISSRNTLYINNLRKALNDLSKGKPNVSIPRQSNAELNEIALAIEELDKDLQSNAKSRKAWLSSISHDLNTPAAAMKMIIDGMNDGVFPLDSESLRELQKENDTLTERIGKVIDFSTLQADTVPVMDTVNASMFADEVLASFPDCARVAADVTCEDIRCDSVLMLRAVTELLKNAVEASGASSEPVRWTISETDGFYEMDIVNEGKLPTDMDSDFFEPWTRGDWSRTAGGSGLGLPIAVTILYLHKGGISIRQQEEDTVKATVRWPKNI